MTRTRRALILSAMTLALFASLMPARAEPSSDPRVADIVRAGKIRIGLHLPQFVKDPATGEIKGSGTGAVIVQIAQGFADSIGVKLELVGNPSPPALVECLKAGACDVGFLGYVLGRTGDVGFTPPHIMVPFTFMVRPGSTIRSVADVDKAGTRIAAVKSHASTITLGRIVKQAETLTVEIPDEAFELIRSGRADAWASPRPPLLEYASKLAGARVLDDRYGENLQALAVAKDQTARLAYASEWVEAAKASGLIQRAIERAGERGIEVAPSEVLTGTTPTR
jgi:polar amino acid transport system substrate-binding protein